MESIGSSEDLFKFTVLLNEEKHALLTRFCFLEFSESTILLFDMLQEYKDEEDVSRKRCILIEAFETYISSKSRNSIGNQMDSSLYDTVQAAVDNLIYEINPIDVDNVVKELEEYTIQRLMDTYERFTSNKVCDRHKPLPKIRITIVPPPMRPWGSMNHIRSPTTPNARRKKKRQMLNAKRNWLALIRRWLKRVSRLNSI